MVTEVASVRIFTAEPDLSQVIKAHVFINIFGRNVAMVVNQGEMLCIVVEEMLGGLSFEQKIFVHKFFHSEGPPVSLFFDLYENINMVRGFLQVFLSPKDDYFTGIYIPRIRAAFRMAVWVLASGILPAITSSTSSERGTFSTSRNSSGSSSCFP